MKAGLIKHFFCALFIILMVCPLSLCFHRQDARSLFRQLSNIRRVTLAPTLVRSFVDVLDVGGSEERGLVRAAARDNLSLVRLLIRRGANINESDSEGKTALHMACLLPSTRMLRLLLLNGAHVDVTDQNNDTPLHYCSKVNHARLLVQHGANLNARNRSGYLPIHVAAVDADAGLISYYIELAPETVDAVGNRQRTSLARAAVFGNRETAEVLLQMGADVNARDNTGQTILHHAVREDNDEFVGLLLKWDPDVFAKDNAGKTVLTIAAEEYLPAHLPHYTPLYPQEERIVHRRAVVKSLLYYGVPIESSTEAALVLGLQSPDFNPNQIIRDSGNEAYRSLLLLQQDMENLPDALTNEVLRFVVTPELG